MDRIPIEPREDWQKNVEQWGLLYHDNRNEDGAANLDYWNESAYYLFTPDEIDVIEAATNELHEMCLNAVQHVIDARRYSELAIPKVAIPWIERSWSSGAPSLYGRFDLGYDGVSPPKLLEYNADTPTSLLEAAVVQWKWLEERFPDTDQFNSIWEGLVEKFTEMRTSQSLKGRILHFAHLDTIEEFMTVAVLRDTAHEAGLTTEAMFMEEIGWDHNRRFFVDLDNRRIESIFKLYPWEWMLTDSFALHMFETMGETQWIEPIWKMILSNKGILPILWELYPDHPCLLQAYADGPRDMASYVEKPLLGREGGNVSIVDTDPESSRDFGYGSQGYVFQELYELPNFDGNHPVIGSWVIDGVSRGMGIRESTNRITDELSSFVPHLFWQPEADQR